MSGEPPAGNSLNFPPGGSMCLVATNSAKTINLPAPDTGRVVHIVDSTGGANQFPITILPTGAGVTIRNGYNTIVQPFGTLSFLANNNNWYAIVNESGIDNLRTLNVSNLSVDVISTNYGFFSTISTGSVFGKHIGDGSLLTNLTVVGLTTISNLLNSVSTNVTNVSTNLNTLSNNVTTVSNTAGTNATNITTISNRINYLLTVSSYSAITMSTSFGFFSTISTGSIYGRHIGDGSLLTGLPAGGLTILPPIMSTTVMSSGIITGNSISTLNISSALGYISSLTVDSLSFGVANGFINMGDLITTSMSSIQIFTSSLLTTNLQVGIVSSLSYIAFPGLQLGYNQSVVAEQAIGTGLQELLVFKGSSASDRIRMQTTGSIVFEPGVSARLFPTAGSNVTPAMIINTSSNVGIGTATPGVTLDVVGGGRFTALSVNTISTNFIVANNISVASLSTTYGFFSTISSGSFYGQHIGDGSLLTNIPNNGAVLAISNSLVTTSTNLNTLSNTVGTNAGTVTTLTTLVNNISTNVTTISTNLNTLSNTVGTNAGTVTTLATLVNNISTNVTTISTNLNTVSNSLVTTSTNLNTLSNSGRFPAISTNTISTSLIIAGYVSSPQAYISSLIVDSLAFGLSNSYISMGDIITTSISTTQVFTSSLLTTNLQVGTVSSLSYIAFPGLQLGYNQTVIAEQSIGTGLQELLVFRGSSASDRIRMQTTGSIVFEPGVGARVFPATGSNLTPAMIINTSSNVGIGIAVPTTTLDVAGTGRFQMLSTQQIYVSSISSGSVYGRFVGDGSLLTGLPAGGLSIVPSFLSTTTLSTNLLTASNISTNSISTNNLTVSNLYGNGTTVLTGLSVNTISTNQVNSASISNSGVISTLGLNVGSLSSINISTVNLAAGFISSIVLGSQTAYITNLYVGTEDFGSALTASSNITQTGGTTTLAGLSVNTISTNQINSSNICNAGWLSNGGILSNTTAAAFFQATSNTTTLGVAQTATFASNITQTGGTTTLAGLSVNTLSTNQINSSNICNAGWLSNGGVLSNTTAAAFFQATSNTTTLGVAGILTAASNITQTGGTTTLAGLSVNTLSTNQINSSNICNAGWLSNNGIFSNITAAAFFQATSNTTTLGVAQTATFASNIIQTAGTTMLAGLSVNTISTNQINSSNICNAGWLSNNGIFSNTTAAAFFQATSNTTTLGVAQTATFASNITQTAGTTTLAGLSVNTLSTNQINSSNISTTGINVGSLSSINISTLNLAAGFISTLTLGARTAYITNLFVGTEDFGSALTSSSNITQTGGTTVLAGLSVNTISTNNITASNISTNSISTNFGFFSTISANTIYGKHVGDGSLLTGITGSGGAGVTSTLSTLVFLTSSISTANITSQQGYISSLTVDYLAIGSNYGYVNMGDVIATSLSSIAIETQTITTGNLKVGVVSSLSYIAFPGLQQGYTQGIIAEQSTGTGLQELLIFRGSSASDRIRMQTTGSIVFEPGVGARIFPSAPSNATPAMIINTSSNVGIGTATPGVTLDVAGAGRFTAVSTNTISTASITAGATLNVTATAASFSGEIQSQGGTVRIVGNATTLDLWNYCSLTQTSGNITINSYSNINTTSSSNININATSTIYISSGASAINLSGNLDLNNKNITNVNFTRPVAVSTNTISTNIVNAGYLVGLLPGNTATISVSPLAVGNGNAYLSFSPQIEFQYNSGGYKHFMGSRHEGNVANAFGNAIDFWLYSATTGANASTTPGTCNVNTMSVTAAGVGIFNNSPSLALDVAGGGRFTALSTIIISTGLLTASNISTNTLNSSTINISSVGINCNSPSYTLDVNGNARVGGMFFDTNAFAWTNGTTHTLYGDSYTDSTKYIQWAYNNTPGTTIADAANMNIACPLVGINCNTPGLALDVAGAGRFTAVSTNIISTNTILANNISTASLAAYEGFFSTFGTELGFSQEAYFSTIFTENLIGQKAYLSSLNVNSILNADTAFIIMGDVLANSLSTNMLNSSNISNVGNLSNGGSATFFSNGTTAASPSTTNAYPYASFTINSASTNTLTPVTPLLLMTGGYGGSIAGGLTQSVGPILTLGTIDTGAGGGTKEGYRLTGSNSAFYGNVDMQSNTISNIQDFYFANGASFLARTNGHTDLYGKGAGYYFTFQNGNSYFAHMPNGDINVNTSLNMNLNASNAIYISSGTSAINVSGHINMNNNSISNVSSSIFFQGGGFIKDYTPSIHLFDIDGNNCTQTRLINGIANIVLTTTDSYFGGDSMNMLGNLNVTASGKTLNMSNNNIILKDNNHGLVYGDGSYRNVDIDGPFLYGYSAGALGVTDGGDSIKLSWDRTTVNINTSTINLRGTANSAVRIGPSQYEGTAADTTTYGLERSRHELRFAGYRDAQIDKIGSKIVNINKQTYGNSGLRQLIQSADLAFFTVPPDTADIDNTVERMRITDSGNVGIGTTAPTVTLDVAGAGRFTAVSTNTISTNIINSSNICNAGFISNNGILSNLGGTAYFAATSNTTTLGVAQTATFASNITQTAGTTMLSGLSVNTISTNFIVASNISTNSISTTYGFFSTISSGTFYGRHIGDGSGLTGISAGGSSAIPEFVSTNTLSTGILNAGTISSISTVTNTLLAPGSTILGITLSKMQIQNVTGTTLLFTGTTPILNSSISGINYILSNSGMSQVSIPIFASMSPQGQFDGWFMTLRNATASYLTLTTMTCNVNAAGYVTIPPANSLTLAYSPGNGYFGWVQF